MELKRLTERIFYSPSEAETDRPVLGYVRGDKYSLLIDAGNSPAHVELFYRGLEKLHLPRPDYVAITHWHWDHTFGMCAVDAKTISSRLTNEKLKVVATWSWTDEAMKRRLETGEDIEFCDRCIRLVYPDRSMIKVQTADITFDNTMTLDLGGVHCELRHIGGPHSEDSVSIYIPEERTLFIGDADCEDHYYNNGKYDPVKLKDYINYIETLDYDFYVLGHDEPENKEKSLTYLRDELAKISYHN